MKITLGSGIVTNVTRGINDIPVGQPFKATIGSVQGLFLRTYSNVVYLPDPSKTYSYPATFTKYVPVVITIETED